MSRTFSINFPNTETELETPLGKLQRAACNKLLVTGGLAIHGSASTLAKIANAIYYLIDGTLCTLAAADLPALSGTVVNGTFNVFAFYVNAAGTVVTVMGTAASTLAGVVFPTIPDGNISIGFVIINPTGTGNFVGGTTHLDDGTVVPNAVYVNTVDVFSASLATL
jgi:hypothetical protein